MAGCEVKCGEHRFLAFADRQSAYGIAVETDIGELVRAYTAQFLVQRALLDTEQCGSLRVFAARIEPIAAAPGPAHAHFHARGDFIAQPIGARAFVERHHDVAAQHALDFHAALGRKHVLGTVDVAAELDPLLGELAQFGQAHHLVAATVGQDGPLPVHELVQAAKPRHPLGAGSQHEVVGVAEDNVGPCLADSFGLHRLDCRCSPDRHESRRANGAALHGNVPCARSPVGRVDGECETFAHGQKP